MILIPFREMLVDDVTDFISDLTSSQVRPRPSGGLYFPVPGLVTPQVRSPFPGRLQGRLQPDCNPTPPDGDGRRRTVVDRTSSLPSSSTSGSGGGRCRLPVGADGHQFSGEHSGQQLVEAQGDLLGEPNLSAGRALADRYVGDD